MQSNLFKFKGGKTLMIQGLIKVAILLFIISNSNLDINNDSQIINGDFNNTYEPLC